MDKLKTFTRNKRTNVNMDMEVLQKGRGDMKHLSVPTNTGKRGTAGALSLAYGFNGLFSLETKIIRDKSTLSPVKKNDYNGPTSFVPYENNRLQQTSPFYSL